MNQTALIIGGAALLALLTSSRGNSRRGASSYKKPPAGGRVPSTPSSPSGRPSTPSYTPSQSTTPSGASSADVRLSVEQFQEAINDYRFNNWMDMIQEDGLLGSNTIRAYNEVRGHVTDRLASFPALIRQSLQRNPLPTSTAIIAGSSLTDGVYTAPSVSAIEQASDILSTLV